MPDNPQDIFGQEGATQDPEQSTGNSDQLSGQDAFVSQLVGEGKKYATFDALAKSRIDADEHISKLEAEAQEQRAIVAELQEKLNGASTVEDVLATIKGSSNSAGQETPTQHMDEEAIDELIERKMTAKEKANTKNTNVSNANSAAIEAFGSVDEARKVVNQKASALGMSTQDLLNIAAKSPSGFLELIGANKPKATPSQDTRTTQGTINSQAGYRPPGEPAAGTQAYYSKLRRENPTAYLSPKVQNQMFVDRKTKGEAFYS